MEKIGILYGIGIGPGDPDLLTVKAIHTLKKVDVVLAAASPKNEHSFALEIARSHLPENIDIVRLDFPMTRNVEKLKMSWKSNADIVATIIHQGKNAAFITLGDPLIYSTFGYLMKTFQANHPELPVQVIPGITSFQAAAAKTQTILCEGEENLTIIPGINEEKTLTTVLNYTQSAVILKAYSNRDAICNALRASGKEEEVVFVSKVGLDGECIAKGISNIHKKPTYLSLVLAPAKRN